MNEFYSGKKNSDGERVPTNTAVYDEPAPEINIVVDKEPEQGYVQQNSSQSGRMPGSGQYNAAPDPRANRSSGPASYRDIYAGGGLSRGMTTAGQSYGQQPPPPPYYGQQTQQSYGQPGQPYAQPQYRQPQYAAPQAQKDEVVTFILCLLLGFFGVHRFYERKIITGALMLISFGGFGIWWIADLIINLVKMIRKLQRGR